MKGVFIVKKILSFLLCAILITTILPTLAFAKQDASAKQNTAVNTDSGQPSEQFKEFCVQYFAEHSKYHVIAKQGNDINEKFFNDNIKKLKDDKK